MREDTHLEMPAVMVEEAGSALRFRTTEDVSKTAFPGVYYLFYVHLAELESDF